MTDYPITHSEKDQMTLNYAIDPYNQDLETRHSDIEYYINNIQIMTSWDQNPEYVTLFDAVNSNSFFACAIYEHLADLQYKYNIGTFEDIYNYDYEDHLLPQALRVDYYYDSSCNSITCFTPVMLDDPGFMNKPIILKEDPNNYDIDKIQSPYNSPYVGDWTENIYDETQQHIKISAHYKPNITPPFQSPYKTEIVLFVLDSTHEHLYATVAHQLDSELGIFSFGRDFGIIPMLEDCYAEYLEGGSYYTPNLEIPFQEDGDYVTYYIQHHLDNHIYNY